MKIKDLYSIMSKEEKAEFYLLLLQDKHGLDSIHISKFIANYKHRMSARLLKGLRDLEHLVLNFKEEKDNPAYRFRFMIDRLTFIEKIEFSTFKYIGGIGLKTFEELEKLRKEVLTNKNI